MIAQRVVDIYAIVHDGLYADYRVYPDGRVHTWAYGAIRWVDLDKDHPEYEAIRDAGLKAINEDQEFEKYAKEHGIEPSDEYGSTYQLAKYWFMLVQRKPLLYVLESKEDSGSSSWEGKVDTQSGAFTQDEIDNSTAWR